jgi:photosystem II stability/assembly factor-like uncharacterized protein
METAPCYPESAFPRFIGLFSFNDSQNGWTLCNAPTPGAGMEGRTLYRTTDGGHSWMLIAEGDLPGDSRTPTPTTNTMPTSADAPDLFMLDGTAGWIGTRDGIFETRDAGRTWRRQGALGLRDEARTWRGPWATSDRYGWIDVRALVFLTSTHGFALREEWDSPDEHVAHDVPVLYESMDGGDMWTQVQCGFGAPCAPSTPTASQ